MDADLQKLRIDKSKKASRQAPSKAPWVIVLLLLLGVIGYAGWQYRAAHAATGVQTMVVRLPEGAVSDADLVALQATGYVEAAHKIELASKVIGRIAWVGVEMGDKVKAGQVLCRLEDEEYQARALQAKGMLASEQAKLAELIAGNREEEVAKSAANLAEAQADLTNAKINLKRLHDLEVTRSVSRQQIDDAEALVSTRTAQVEAQSQSYQMMKKGARKEEIDAQKAVVTQMEGGLRLAQVDLDNTVIKAPMDATILGRNVEVGEFVTTGFSGEGGAKGYVLSIADLNDLRVDLDISQNDFAKIRGGGQPCWIVTDAYPDRKYEGRVDLISPEANRQKATVEVRVKVLHPDDMLKPDMNATVSFLNPDKLAATSQPTATRERPVLRIPSSAVVGGEVFVVDAGKAAKRPVVVGTVVSGETEIRKGLAGGEELILSPPPTLKDNDPVKVLP